MSDPTRLRRPAAVLWRAGLDVLVLRGPDGEPTTVTGSGAAVWDALEEPKSLDELVAVVAERFSVEPASIVADIRRLVDDLTARGLLERR